MRRGQTESSFQWIFVLIAGAVFLTIFLFAFRSCTQSGQDRIQSNSIKSAAVRISGDAWQPDVNDSLSLPQLTVSCPANATLVLTTTAKAGVEPASAYLDRAPAFLPPVMGGKSRTVTRTIALESSPTITLGSALYATSENTYYYVINDPLFRQPLGILGPDPKIKTLNSIGDVGDALQGLPSSAIAIIVSTTAIDPAAAITPEAGATMYWVRVDSPKDHAGSVQFYEFRNGAFQKTGQDQYATDYLLAGAIITARPETYLCAKTNVASRIRYVTAVAQGRAAKLKGSGALTPQCQNLLGQSEQTLNRINKPALSDNQYLQQLFASAEIPKQQRVLNANSCPVIA